MVKHLTYQKTWYILSLTKDRRRKVMNKCAHCGTEFNGNFCPECGMPAAQESTADSGGTIQYTRKKQTNADAAYRILSYIPALLFAFFGLLMLILFATPVMKISLLKDVSIEGASLYSGGYLDYFSTLEGVRVAMLTVGVLSLLMGIAVAVLRFVPLLQNKILVVQGKVFFWHEVAAMLAPLFYFIMFVLACVTIGKISAADEGLGIFKPAACPYTVLVFSLLIFLAITGVYVAMFLLARNGAGANLRARKEELGAQRAVEKEKIKAQRVAEKEKLIAELSNPFTLEKLQNTRKPATMRAQSAVKLKWCSIVFAVFLTVGNFVCRGFWLFEIIGLHFLPTNPSTPITVFVLKMYLLFLGACILFEVPFLFLRIEGIYSEIRRYKGYGAVLSAVLLMLLNVYSFWGCILRIGVLDLVLLFVAIIACIANLVAQVAVKRCFRRLRAEVYGTAKPTADALPLHKVDENEVSAYKRCRRSIRLCKKYKLAKIKPTSDALAASSITVAVFASFILFVSVVFCIYTPVAFNPYSATYVREIAFTGSFAFSWDFGEPTVIGKDGDRTYYALYSGKYGECKKQLSDKRTEIEEAVKAGNETEAKRIKEKIDLLKKKMQGMRYKYLCITFNGKKLQTIVLDTKRVAKTDDVVGGSEDGKFAQKQVKSARKLDDGVEIFYTDGSYFYDCSMSEVPKNPDLNYLVAYL